MVFMNMWEAVSGVQEVLSPNLSSTVHTLRPLGTILSFTFVESFLPPKLYAGSSVALSLSVILCRSCACAVRKAHDSRRAGSILFNFISPV